MSKAVDAFRTISEVADDLGIPKHVLRFWEAKFAQIRPMKRGGGRRYYRPEDMELLKGIRQLLHRDGYTIKGVQKILREQGVDAVKLRDPSTGAADISPPQASLDPKPIENASAGKVAPRARQKALRPALAHAATGRSRGAAIAAAIAELEACRTLLSAAVTGSIGAAGKAGGAMSAAS